MSYVLKSKVQAKRSRNEMIQAIAFAAPVVVILVCIGVAMVNPHSGFADGVCNLLKAISF